MSNKCKKGSLLVLSGPSGVGKGTVCSMVLKHFNCLVKSISVSTRSPRAGEVDGVNYFFKTTEQYEQIRDSGGFLETFEIYGNHYGTPKQFVLDNLNKGISVLLEIDVQGALAVKENMPEAILIFLSPPSIEDLKLRLKKRNSEDEASYQRRITSAESEISQKEKYDYIVINDDINKAAEQVKQIISKYTN